MTPAKQGYYLPAEWQLHRATWISWPHNSETWPGGIDSIFQSYLQLIKQVSLWETVCINVSDHDMKMQAMQRLKRAAVDLKMINFFFHPTNDAWCRDHGPCFLINKHGRKLIVNWGYNAWGGKYPPFELDNSIPEKVAAALELDQVNPNMVLEGGSIEVNGQGTLLTTSACLLNPNRNPGLSKAAIEQKLKDYLSINQVLWLPCGIDGDDTDGHIDTLVRFIDTDTVVAIQEEDPLDTNYHPLQENLRALRKMRLPNGNPLNIVTIPMPKPIFYQNQRLPASYANYYVCNGAVIVPTYRDPNDAKILAIFEKLFIDKRIVGIDSREIIRGLGSFHCLCREEPL